MADSTPIVPVEVTFLAEPRHPTEHCADISLSFQIDPQSDKDLNRTVNEFFCFLGALGWADVDAEAAIRHQLDVCY